MSRFLTRAFRSLNISPISTSSSLIRPKSTRSNLARHKSKKKGKHKYTHTRSGLRVPESSTSRRLVYSSFIRKLKVQNPQRRNISQHEADEALQIAANAAVVPKNIRHGVKLGSEKSRRGVISRSELERLREECKAYWRRKWQVKRGKRGAKSVQRGRGRGRGRGQK